MGGTFWKTLPKYTLSFFLNTLVSIKGWSCSTLIHNKYQITLYQYFKHKGKKKNIELLAVIYVTFTQNYDGVDSMRLNNFIHFLDKFKLFEANFTKREASYIFTLCIFCILIFEFEFSPNPLSLFTKSTFAVHQIHCLYTQKTRSLYTKYTFT